MVWRIRKEGKEGGGRNVKIIPTGSLHINLLLNSSDCETQRAPPLYHSKLWFEGGLEIFCFIHAHGIVAYGVELLSMPDQLVMEFSSFYDVCVVEEIEVYDLRELIGITRNCYHSVSGFGFEYSID